jgi:hypothetical protein
MVYVELKVPIQKKKKKKKKKLDEKLVSTAFKLTIAAQERIHQTKLKTGKSLPCNALYAVFEKKSEKAT